VPEVVFILSELHFTPYTAKQLSPDGWLRRQLEIQAKGLNGSLDKIWPDVRDSKWIGGNREGWERVPYWLDGFIPLAYLLDDNDMKARAKRYIDAILSGQQEDGWLCPCSKDERARYDMWALFLICKVLVQYHDCTGDSRIETAVYKALRNLDLHIESVTLFNWAAMRWYECLIPLFWLYSRRAEPWMIGLCRKLDEQGADYEKIFENWQYTQPHEHGRWSLMTHVVNHAMMLKSRALFSRISGENPNAFAQKAIAVLLRDHGLAAEHFSGDECLSGTGPIQGTEFCSVVEAMYSYEWLAAVTGDSEWCDRLEIAAYNTLPAAVSPDMWIHQYNQMTNQAECSVLDKPHFRTNNGESHLFGLEPNYGCCTANFGQGWPKFALSALMEAHDGIAVTAIAPCKLKTSVSGIEVQITIETEYPFEDAYKIIVETPAPVEFTVYIRVPGSAKSAVLEMSDGSLSVGPGFYPVRRSWANRNEMTVALKFETELRKRPSGMYCVWRGPLLYALPVREEWRKREYTENGVERKFPYCDYELYPRSKWNYAFAGQDSGPFRWERRSVGELPFQPEKPPVTLTAKMTEINWRLENGVCTELPADLMPLGEPEELQLIPYGCTNLRMTEMPLL
jgi:hypothetical protein